MIDNNPKEILKNQLSFDFERKENNFKKLAVDVKEFITNYITHPRQPSAAELLDKVEEKYGWQSRLVFSEVINKLRNDQTLQKYLREYLNTNISEEAINSALRSGLNATKEFRSTLDDLFKRSVNYRNSEKFREALEFASKFRDYAPYNNFLIKIQNPSCSYYATEKDWWVRFKRRIKEDARPMLILAPMHPVMLVYDLDNTEGAPLPKHFMDFNFVEGEWDDALLYRLLENADRLKILVQKKDLSTTNLGFATTKLRNDSYKMRIALHHLLPKQSQFAVLIHELAHILLGHLGTDEDKTWPCRINLSHSTVEIEAESVSHIVCDRLGIKTSADSYLASFLSTESVPESISVDLLFKVAGKIEDMTKKLLKGKV